MKLNSHLLYCLFFIAFLPQNSFSQDSSYTVSNLKQLSIDELMSLEVSLVSRNPEKLNESPSAVQVITGEDIRRSTASNIPEALRLVSNLQVAQLNSSAWIISSRGFNTIFANKLLVMIDGRTVYTPLFGGVLWEMQNVNLEDVERIEVVSGPGATLWGANAVNGVINIITKNSSNTQGTFLSVQAGNHIERQAIARYGGKVGKSTFRSYAQHFARGETELKNGNGNKDSWYSTHGGFRVDIPGQKSEWMIQGDYQSGTRRTPQSNSDFNTQDVVVRWNRWMKNASNLMVQAYYDRYYRDDVPSKITDVMKTFDLDAQYQFRKTGKHRLMAGLGARFVKDETNSNVQGAAILPVHKRLDRYNLFVQDDIEISRKLRAIIGTKLGHNVYTGIEVQPSARLSLQMPRALYWTAVSRALRTPSRFDVDYYIPGYPVPPPDPSVAGGPDFESEILTAYEAGIRLRTGFNSFISLSLYYNDYKDVYSVEPLPGTLTYQIQNGSKAESWGGEVAVTTPIKSWWKLRSGYTYMDHSIRPKPGHIFNGSYLANDARNQLFLHSILNISRYFEFDITARYLDFLPKTLATERVSSYGTFDVRLAYVSRFFDIIICGTGLLEDHEEFNVTEIKRGFFGKVNFKF